MTRRGWFGVILAPFLSKIGRKLAVPKPRSTSFVLLGMDTHYLESYFSHQPKFQFGFTGFKETRGSFDGGKEIQGLIIWGSNIIQPGPRFGFRLVDKDDAGV